MNRIMLWLTVLGLLSTVHHPAWSDEPGGIKRCWQRFWERARQFESNLKSSCRRCTQNWCRDKPTPDYGLHTLPLRIDVPSDQLVVFVHGLNSRPEDLEGLIAEVERAGHWCATFRYPNDQDIASSATLLSQELRVIYDAFLKDDDLSETQACVTEQRHILEKYMPFPPLLKALAAHKYGFPHWPVRPPLSETPQELIDQAAKELEECEA